MSRSIYTGAAGSLGGGAIDLYHKYSLVHQLLQHCLTLGDKIGSVLLSSPSEHHFFSAPPFYLSTDSLSLSFRSIYYASTLDPNTT